ncbi:MAG: hypothetical protein CMF62_02140 [Magnetococcales bacterium]|nr:hypothetical protein [Magnetococcales bacterium]
MYRDKSFIEKKNNAIVILIIGAVLGILLSNEIEKQYPPIGKGIKYGGFILFLSTFINFFPYMNDEMKLLGTISLFTGVIYSYNKFYDK